MNDQSDEVFLLTTLLGQTLLERQLRALVAVGLEQVIVFLPLASDRLREQIRTLAVQLPIRLATVNLDPKFDFWQNLVSERARLPDQLLLGAATDLSLPYCWGQLRVFRAPLVAAVQTSRPARWQGTVRIEGRYLAAVSSQAIRHGAYLTGTYWLGRELLDFLPDQLAGERAWLATLDNFVQEYVAKPCFFETGPIGPAGPTGPLTGEARVRLAHHFFAALTPEIAPTAQLAPGVRGTARLVARPGARVADYTLLDGEIYLGEGVQVGPFCQLHDCYLEAGCQVAAYSQLSGCHLTPDSQVITSLRTKIIPADQSN